MEQENNNNEKNIFFNSVALLTYSHSSFQDVLDIYFIQLNKFFSPIKGYLLINKIDCNIPNNHKVIYYNDKKSYYDHLLYATDIIQEEYIIYMQDDYFLFGKPNYNILNQALTRLKSRNLDFIRLIRTGTDNISDNI